MTALGRIAFCIVFSLASHTLLHAQDKLLEIGAVIEAELAPRESHQYSLTALESTLLSFRVEALDDTLDPQLEIFDNAGNLLAANDDYNYPETRDAALQAFAIPRTMTYTIAVSGFDDSSGGYRLHVLPGYDRLALRDTAMDNFNWEVVYSDTAVNFSDSSLFAVDLAGLSRSAILLGQHFPAEQDLYFEAKFEYVTSPGNWQVGLVFRYLAPDKYHRLLLSKTGYWQLQRVDGDTVTQLRNWSTHPAIVPGEDIFRLGILVSGQHYDVVYNGQVVGSAWDESRSQPASVGIAMRTDETIGGQLSFAITETLMTVPTRLDGVGLDGKLIFPQRLPTTGSYQMANILARQQLIPVGGEIKLTLPESSVRRVQPGVTRLPIASDLSFAEFALGASVSADLHSPANGGCGIIFHFHDEENYTLAYLTMEGDYGLSRRAGAGFLPGVYGAREQLEGDSHQLLIIVTAEVIHYYLDEIYVGSLPAELDAGGIGIAVVNYEEVTTNCLFKDLWLLSLDG